MQKGTLRSDDRDDGEYVPFKKWNYVLSIFIVINWAYFVKSRELS